MQELDYNNGKKVFSMWSVLRSYKQGTKLVESSVKFHTGDCEDRTSAHEAEESPLLVAVAREWLVKTG
jgi:hypothetical protein